MGIFDWFRSRKAPPTAAAPPPPCHPLLVGATRVRVRRAGEAEVLFESVQADDLTTLGAALDAEASPYGLCMCIGTLDIDFERAGASPTTVTLHHGVSLRWKESKGNVNLRSPDAIMDWLSARGMPFVREEYEARPRSATHQCARRWCPTRTRAP